MQTRCESLTSWSPVGRVLFGCFAEQNICSNAQLLCILDACSYVNLQGLLAFTVLWQPAILGAPTADMGGTGQLQEVAAGQRDCPPYRYSSGPVSYSAALI